MLFDKPDSTSQRKAFKPIDSHQAADLILSATLIGLSEGLECWCTLDGSLLYVPDIIKAALK